jgi:hypothetical protein
LAQALRAVFASLALVAPLAAQVTPRDVDLTALTAAAETRKAAITVVEVMKSAAGAPVNAMLVGIAGQVPVAARPRLLVVAGLEPDHAGGILVAARLASDIVELAAGDEKLRAVLERCSVEIIPCLAVDGVAAAQASGLVQPARTDTRPVDDDRDGVADEDGAEDLNGDGVVTEMRVKDPLGEWRVSEDDPRLMVRADRAKGEVGSWRLEPEGVDDDGDGRINEDPKGGVDFDRNFPHGWKEFDRRTGTSPCSEVETRALVDHVLATRNVAAVLVLGHRDSLVETPPAMKAANPAPDGLETEDRPLFEAVSEKFRKRTGFERKSEDKPDGAFHQWAYFQQGLPAFAAKVFEPPKPPQPASLPSGKKAESDDAKRLVDSDTRLGGKGFVDWKPFQHPVLGAVEIGGFVPLADVNPTAERVPEISRAFAQFVFDLLEMLPRATLQDVSARPLGGGLHEITAVVRNEGRFPTVLRIGTRTRAVLPSRIVVDLPVEAFELGERRTLLEPLGAAGQGRKLRWIVRAGAGTTAPVRLWTEKAGEAAADVTFTEPK